MSNQNFRNTYPAYLTCCLLALVLLCSLGCGETVGVSTNPAFQSPDTEITQQDERGTTADSAEVVRADELDGCAHDTECAEHGAWQVCLDTHCVTDAAARTLRLGALDLEEPSELNDTLGLAFEHLFESGDLNLLVHLGHSENWMIQGIPSGSVDGRSTYGQSQRFGSYRGQGETRCEDGRCSVGFAPDSNDRRLTIYVRDGSQSENSEQCAYQVLELMDVVIQVDVDVDEPDQIDSSIRITGLLSESTASAFIMNDGAHLYDVLARNGMEMNSRSTDGRVDGWRLSFVAQGTEVIFDNDPGARFSQRPTNPSDGASEDGSCP